MLSEERTPARNRNAYLCLLAATKLREDCSDTLSLRISDGSQAVASICTDHKPGDVRDDEP